MDSPTKTDWTQGLAAVTAAIGSLGNTYSQVIGTTNNSRPFSNAPGPSNTGVVMANNQAVTNNTTTYLMYAIVGIIIAKILRIF